MNATCLKILGANLRRERSAKNFTQQQLAEKADLHITSVQRIERGQFDLRTSTLFRIVQALQCPAERVFPSN